MTGTDPVLCSSRLTASSKPTKYLKVSNSLGITHALLRPAGGSTRRSVQHARTVSPVLALAPAATAFLVLGLQWHLLLLVAAQRDCSEVIGVLALSRCRALAALTVKRKGSLPRGHSLVVASKQAYSEQASAQPTG